MLTGLNGSSIARFHDQVLTSVIASHAAATESPRAWHWIAANHQYNIMLWREEDKARRTDVEEGEIAACKRRIDQYNQKRNDATEALDEAILAQLGDVQRAIDARLNSETAGGMIDRLSILALKIFHMREQTERSDADPGHIEICQSKLQRLIVQRQDLASCLDDLLTQAVQGRAYFKVYRQFKMYNDPALNPYLYQQRQAASDGKAVS
jgi:hypothetical protein